MQVPGFPSRGSSLRRVVSRSGHLRDRPTGSELPMCALPSGFCSCATLRHRVTPAGYSLFLQPWQQTPEVSAHIGRRLPSVVRGTAGRNSPHECSRARVAAMVRASTSSQLGGALPAASGPHPNSFAPGETSGRSPPLPAAHQSTLFSGLTSVHERCGQGSTFSFADRSCLP